MKRDKIVKQYCDRNPKTGNLTVAKLLHKHYPRMFATVEVARNSVRYYRGAQGVKNRKQIKELDRMNQGLRKPSPIPKSYEEPWQQIQLDCERLAVISDIHVPYHSVEALTACFDFLDEWKPDCILINGDLFDFYMISRFPKDKSRPTVKRELEIGKELLTHIKERFGCPIWYKLGNHDERYEQFLWDACPEIFDIASNVWRDVAGINQLGVNVVDNQAIVMAGKLPILHGHELPRGMASPVNPARGAFLRTNDPVLVGHYHRQSEHAERSMLGAEVAAYSTGCLCGLTPKYARVNKWNHGFATVQINRRNGKYKTHLRRIIKNEVF